MKFDKIIIMETFPTASFANLKLGTEATIEEGDDMTECFQQARQKLNEAFQKITGEVIHSDKNPLPYISAVDYENVRVAERIRDIEACEVIDHKNSLGVQVGLIHFANETEPRIKAAYDLQMIKLSKK